MSFSVPTSARPLRFDVSDVVGEEASLAATYYPRRADVAAGVVLVCVPGGTYSREYWDLHVPGRGGYSFAEFATAHGYPVLTIDPLGTGESFRPARDFDLADIAATLAGAVGELSDSAHCHNMASGRHRLWRRVLTWAETVVGAGTGH